MIQKYSNLILFLLIPLYSNSLPRIIHARINGTNVLEGKEFISSVQIGSDKERSYTITFKEPFKTEPAIVVNTEGKSNCYGSSGYETYAMPVVFAVDFSSYQDEFNAAKSALVASINAFKMAQNNLVAFLQKEQNKTIGTSKIGDEVKAYSNILTEKAAALKAQADALMKKAQSDCSLQAQYLGNLKDFSSSVASGNIQGSLTSIKEMSDFQKSFGEMGVKLALMKFDQGIDALNRVNILVGVEVPSPSEIAAKADAAASVAKEAVVSSANQAVSAAKKVGSSVKKFFGF